jgi:hypothetical protein
VSRSSTRRRRPVVKGRGRSFIEGRRLFYKTHRRRPPVKGGRRLFVERRPFVQGRGILFVQGRRPWEFIERRPFIKKAVRQEDAVRRAKREIVRPRKEPFCLTHRRRLPVKGGRRLFVKGRGRSFIGGRRPFYHTGGDCLLREGGAHSLREAIRQGGRRPSIIGKLLAVGSMNTQLRKLFPCAREGGGWLGGWHRERW